MSPYRDDDSDDYNTDALTNLDRFVLFALAASVILITLAGVFQ